MLSNHEENPTGNDPELLQQMIDAARADVPSESEWCAARQELMDQLHNRRKESVMTTVFRAARSSKTGWTVSAVAAMVILAVGLMLFDRGPGLAFADVLERIGTFRPYACSSTTRYEGRPPYTRRIMRLSLARRREIRPDGTIFVVDMSGSPNRTLTLLPKRKMAIEKTLASTEPKSDPDWLTRLGKMKAGSAEDLGTREVDGYRTHGFHVPDEINDITIWADVETGMPIRIELVQPSIERKIIITDFQFDVDFEESLFSTTAPEGYAVEKLAPDGNTPTEEDLLEGLRAAATFMHGAFPSAFDYAGVRKALNEYVEEQNLSPTREEYERLGERLSRAVRYVQILEGFRKVRNLHYKGEGVKLGDKVSPIFYWQPQGTETYRVVYGDLSVRDVPPEQLRLSGIR